MNFLFKRTTLTRTLFFILADIFFIALSMWLAFFLRFDANIPDNFFPLIFRMVLLVAIFIIPTFYFNKLYSFSWSYVSAYELISLFKATTISFVFLSIAIFISNFSPNFINFPRSTIFISYILVFIFCGGIRFSKRIYLYISGRGSFKEKEKTLIAGAGDAGEQILRSILNFSETPYNIVGFVDDNHIKKGVSIHGARVLGKIEDIPALAEKYQIKQLIVALPSVGSRVIKNAIELARKAGITKIKIAPPLSEIIKGKVSFNNLKNVETEDLLQREQISLDIAQIQDFIKLKTVLITGAAGSIGSELSRQLAGFKPKCLLLLDQDETGIFNISKELEENFSGFKIISLIADIRDENKTREIFREHRPQIVFHAAAYKHVPLMEENPDEAIKNNVFGIEILARASLENNVENFIFVSTDKAVNPVSVMGATKRIGEMICQTSNQKNHTKFISVRFGNVLNSRGSVIPIFREQINRGGPVEITDPEMKRYFMLISEACLLVLQSSAMGEGGEVFVLDMGKPVKILDLARNMIKLSGFEPDKDIAIVFTGRRPGEKLFEEILTAEEGTIATQNKKIFKAKLSNVNPSDLEQKLDELRLAVNNNNKEKLKDALMSLVLLYKKEKN